MGKRTSLFFLEQYGFSFENLKDFIMGRNVAREKKDRPYICIWTGHMEWADLALDMEKREAEDSFWTRGGPSQRRCVRPHTVRRLPSTVKRTSKSAYGMPYIRSG